MKVTKENLTAANALDQLIQGNARFTNGLRSVETLLNGTKIKTLAEKGQFPFCILVTCSDSRIPIELIFDRGLGDLFVVRTFGNVIDEYALASIEYALLNFGIKTIVVMGHTRAGAVRKTMENEALPPMKETPSLRGVLAKIKPCLQKVRDLLNYQGPLKREGIGQSMWEKIFQLTSVENIRENARRILQESDIISEKVRTEELFVVPARYCIDNGKLTFEIPPKLASHIEKTTVARQAFRQGETAMEILEDSLKEIA